MKRINKIVVIGATGAVGKTVSGIFASFGNAIVYMIGRNIDKLEKAKYEAALSVKSMTISENLITKKFEKLEECILDADLVFESVSEDMNLKKEIHKKINKIVKKDTIVATGTSGLSINELAECYDETNKKNFIGIHFFNPPYSMTLCELIPSKYNDKNLINFLKDYLENKLYRDTIIVKDEPAFLANRIGFMLMNEALIYADKYKEYGGIDYIDSILGGYTGRNMKPIETINFVGLDVHKSIVDNLKINSKEDDKESFELPKFMNELIKETKLGIKTGCGLYKKEDNKKMVYDIKNKNYREVIDYNFYYINNAIKLIQDGKYVEGYNIIKNDHSLESDICIQFLLKYIIYSIKITRKLCDDINYCDKAMASGFNWLPPLAMIDALGGKEEVIKLCKRHLKKNYENIFTDIPKSKFDYRKYIKAKI